MGTARSLKVRAAAGIAVAALGLAATPPAEAGRFRTISWTPTLQPGQGAWLSVSFWLPKGARYRFYSEVWHQTAGKGTACFHAYAQHSPNTPNTDGEPMWAIGGGLANNPPWGDPYYLRVRSQDQETQSAGSLKGQQWSSGTISGPWVGTARASGIFHLVFVQACNRPIRKSVFNVGIDGGRFLAQSRGTDASILMDWDLEEHSPYAVSGNVHGPLQLPATIDARAMTPTISKTFKHRAFAFFSLRAQNTVIWLKGPWYPEADNEMFFKVGDTGYKTLWDLRLPFHAPR